MYCYCCDVNPEWQGVDAPSGLRRSCKVEALCVDGRLQQGEGVNRKWHVSGRGAKHTACCCNHWPDHLTWPALAACRHPQRSSALPRFAVSMDVVALVQGVCILLPCLRLVGVVLASQVVLAVHLQGSKQVLLQSFLFYLSLSSPLRSAGPACLQGKTCSTIWSCMCFGCSPGCRKCCSDVQASARRLGSSFLPGAPELLP